MRTKLFLLLFACISPSVVKAAKSEVNTKNEISSTAFFSSSDTSLNPSGNCGINGSNVTWSYNTSTYVLTISGSGQMANYSSNLYPWESYMENIKTVNIGSGVTSIGDFAFGFLYGLTSVSIPSTVTKIGNSAFYCSQKLSSVTIPNSVTSIGEDAFMGCKYLQTINIGSGVSSIGKNAFNSCENTSTITVNTNNATFEVKNGVLINKSTSSAIFIPYRKNDDVVIPEGVTTIDGQLFNNHKYITSITIPSTVTAFTSSYGCFDNCNNLTAINVNSDANDYKSNYVSYNGVLYSKSGWNLALMRCPTKKSGSITIPEHTSYIDGDAFKNCNSITSIMLVGNTPPSVGENSAFASLISSGTKVIVQEPYLNAYKSADIWNTITSWDVIPSCIMVDGIRYCTNYSDPSTVALTSLDNNDKYSGDVVIPSSITYQGVTYRVTDIGWSAFLNSPNLKTISFPATIDLSSYPSSSNFTGCTSLTDINAIGENENYFTYDGVFYYTDSWNNKTYIDVCPPGKEGVVTIKCDVTNLRYNYFPFTNCSKVTSIKLSGESELWAETDGVIYSKDMTKVMLCPPGKANVNLPESVTKVESYAFYNNKEIKSIILPNGVTSIGSSAFYNCGYLESINTPSSLSTIGSNAFYACNALTTVPFPKGATSIPDYAYSGMQGLTSFVVPNTVTSIGKRAFENCQNLESVTIPESVTSIGEGCFQYCTSLKEIVIPSGVTVLNNYIFQACKCLESVTLPKNIVSIGDAAFYGCELLGEIDLPITITNIGGNAFNDCKKLARISIPSGMTKINSSTFGGCI